MLPLWGWRWRWLVPVALGDEGSEGQPCIFIVHLPSSRLALVTLISLRILRSSVTAWRMLPAHILLELPILPGASCPATVQQDLKTSVIKCPTYVVDNFSFRMPLSPTCQRSKFSFREDAEDFEPLFPFIRVLPIRNSLFVVLVWCG